MVSRTDTSVGISGHGTCKRVLLVDSIPSSRAVTEMMLCAEHYTVTAIGSGIEALSILENREADFDFVLTDIHLSDAHIDGFEFLDILHDETSIVVFVLSADFRREVMEECFNKGVCLFYEKPIEKDYIDELWREALDEKLRRQSLESVEGELPFNGDKGQLTGDWSSSLHVRFVEIVKEIGLRNVDAKIIHELLKVPGLTKKDVADHLRIYSPSLMRMEQKAFDQKAQANQDCASSSKR